ncbi:GL18728 [Drosophila persimilis]|uniref:GL18728 n=1 Tax=Drosophila persimilis TaxID=7234 RepID=B4G919_DROPE|nr:RNA polymerase II transcriptional coactivator [Drosophila persimilis]XP_017153181.1 RNA polymerase II transcriptional coactivator [Drosophila miranda]EDW28849.1 GL18728 [Drosophila persimilis]
MPKIKKKQESSSSGSDSGPDDRNQPASKKAKESPAPAVAAKKPASGGGGDGEATTWTLERMRQVRINEFRGRKMVDIREFYEKNGETLPGKKGICLSILQWKKLLEHADEITKAVEN